MLTILEQFCVSESMEKEFVHCLYLELDRTLLFFLAFVFLVYFFLYFIQMEQGNKLDPQSPLIASHGKESRQFQRCQWEHTEQKCKTEVIHTRTSPGLFTVNLYEKRGITHFFKILIIQIIILSPTAYHFLMKEGWVHYLNKSSMPQWGSIVSVR